MKNLECQNSFGDLFLKELQKEALKKIVRIVFISLIVVSLIGAIKHFWM